MNRNANDSIRLISISMFIIFLLPGIMVPHFIRENARTMIIYYSLYSTVFFLIMGLEFIEFFKFSYRYETLFIPRIFFLIRTIVVISPIFFVLFNYIDYGSLDKISKFVIHQMTFLLSILPFYAYYAFSRKTSIIFLVLISLVAIFSDIKPLEDLISDITFLSFLMYRLFTYVLLYALAWLLDKEKKHMDENKTLMDKLVTSEARSRNYAERVAHTVALEERTRIARDIHDSLGHSLTAIKIMLAKAEAYINIDEKETIKAIKAAKGSADDAIRDVRISLKNLNGQELSGNIRTSLIQFIKSLEENEIEVSYKITGNEEDFNYSVLLSLYRFVQEGITNILKHASAKHVYLDIDFKKNDAKFVLMDDGKGFNFTPEMLTEDESDHYGLNGLFRRIELVRGSLTVNSTPGKGTKLTAYVPKNPLEIMEER
ncbi:MAG: sensor histidine kinase [Spirochaetales bacterium]|nr:sensor histidine kinase [Spirochaetales bacterium]